MLIKEYISIENKKGKVMKDLGVKLVSGMTLASLLFATSTVFGYTKEETVYSKIDNKGVNYSTIVSAKIDNENKDEVLEDVCSLLNIENVGGEEEFSQSGEKITWKANGNNIEYKGETKKELPIDTAIKYELDGKEVSAEEIAGKNGKVKITVNFKNKEEHLVNVNGKMTKMYTPFVVVVGTVFSDENAKNVEVSNGKVVDNEQKSIAIGLATPGLADSLDLNEEEYKIPNKVEFTLDAKDFETKTIMCFATAKLIEKNDYKLLNNLDSIYAKSEDLKNASTQLVDGTKKLSDGSARLADGMGELADKLTGLLDEYDSKKAELNSEKIKQKIVKLVENKINEMLPELEAKSEAEAKSVVKSHQSELENSTMNTAKTITKSVAESKLKELENSEIAIPEELENAIYQDVQKIVKDMNDTEEIKALKTQIKTIVMNDVQTKLNEKIGSLSTDITTTKTQVNGATNYSQLVSSEQKASLDQMANAIALGSLTSQGITPESEGYAQAFNTAKAQAQAQITGLIKNTTIGTLDGVSEKVNTTTTETMTELNTLISNDEKLDAAINTYVNKVVTQIKNNMSDAQVKAVKTAIKKDLINAIKTEFANDSTMQKYAKVAEKDVKEVIDGVADKTAESLAKEYTQSLATEVATNLVKKELSSENVDNILKTELAKYQIDIDEKLEQVDGMTVTLRDALKQLKDGSKELSNGANTLAEGMNKFDEEGISKIYDLVNGKVKGVADRVKKLEDLSNEYNSFDGIKDGAKGSVKFIIMIDPIKK